VEAIPMEMTVKMSENMSWNEHEGSEWMAVLMVTWWNMMLSRLIEDDVLQSMR
jgi:hypothetical protein